MITAKILRNRLSYDPETGNFTWLPRLDQRVFRLAGKLAGILVDDVYRKRWYIKVDGKRYLAHRLVWLYVYGRFPPKGMQIDHINGDSSDNRIENLRLATAFQNHANSKIQKGNQTGFKGINRSSSGNYRAQIRHKHKDYQLGTYSTPEEAHAAYCQAAVKFSGEFARFK